MLVQLRQVRPARMIRRASRIAGRAIVFGLAPSIASDSLFEHKMLTCEAFAREFASSALSAAAATSLHDLSLLLRFVRL